MNRATPWPPQTVTDDSPTPWGWLGLLTLLALELRTVGLDGGLWYDEIVTLMDSVRSPLGTILSSLAGLLFPHFAEHALGYVLVPAVAGLCISGGQRGNSRSAPTASA